MPRIVEGGDIANFSVSFAPVRSAESNRNKVAFSL